MGAAAPSRAQCTFLKALGEWEREGTLSARLGFFLWTPARGSPRHAFWLLICAEALTTTPLPCHCTAAPRVALQMFTMPGVLELGVFLTPWACRMTQPYSPRAACSHRSRDGVTPAWNPRSWGLCGLLCLKAAAQSFFQVRLLPFSPTWLLLKGENRGFLVPKQQQSWWPQSNAPPKAELARIFLTCLAMIYPTAFFCSAVWVWSSNVLCVLWPQARQGSTLHPPPLSHLRTGSLSGQRNAKSLYRCTFPSAVSDVSSVNTQNTLKYI